MKKSLKLFMIPMTFLIASNLMGCNVATKEIALITDVGDIDDGSFNQESWEAVKEYCNTNNLTYDYYRPFADSDFARNSAIKQAVYKGAKVIVCPGFKFASAVNKGQYDYPDVKFILLDSSTNDDVRENCVNVGYSCEYSGYLAGYTIMTDYLEYDYNHDGKIDDNYKFGYCGGMASDGVLQFGFGYIQGMICAAKYYIDNCTQGQNYPDLYFLHNYAGVFAQSDDACALMKGWYKQDIPCKAVFACGGKLYQSITEAVKDYNRSKGYYNYINEKAISDGKTEEEKTQIHEVYRKAARWVGVDSDQYAGLKDTQDKNTIVTSALKGLKNTIATCLENYKNNTWSNIGGAYKEGEETKVFTDTIDSETGKPITAQTNAENFIVNQPYTFKNKDAEVEVLDDDPSCRKVTYKKNGKDRVDYCDQVKCWTLGLHSKFGRDEETEKINYVGIPAVAADGSEDGVLRGYFNFTLKNYNDLISEGRSIKCYPNDGTDLLIKSGEGYPSAGIKKGDPSFMGYDSEKGTSSETYYVKDESVGKKYSTFNEYYLAGYPAKKIHVSLI